MQFQISPLSDLPSAISMLADWHHQQWQHLNDPAYDLSARIADYKDLISSQPYPVMFVAHQDGTAFGSVRLIENDMDTHPELSPWMASLFVHEKYRLNRIGSALIQVIEKAAISLNFELIYLYTEDMQKLYKKHGWKIQSDEKYHDQSVTIMSKQLVK